MKSRPYRVVNPRLADETPVWFIGVATPPWGPAYAGLRIFPPSVSPGLLAGTCLVRSGERGLPRCLPRRSPVETSVHRSRAQSPSRISMSWKSAA